MKTVKFLLKRKDASEEHGYEGMVAFVPVTLLKDYCNRKRAEGWSLQEIRK